MKQKTYKRVCKLCGKVFEVEQKSRRQICSDFCRQEIHRRSCAEHYHNVVKYRNLEKKRAVVIPEREPLPKTMIRITQPIDVFDWLRPDAGSVHEAEYAVISEHTEQKVYIIRSIGRHGLIIRDGECVEVGGQVESSGLS